MSRSHGGSVVNTDDKVVAEGKALHFDHLNCEHPSVVKNVVSQGDVVGSVNLDTESPAVYECAALDHRSVVATDQALEDQRRMSAIQLAAVQELNSNQIGSSHSVNLSSVSVAIDDSAEAPT